MRNNISGSARVTGIVNGLTGFMVALAGLTIIRLGDRYDRFKLLRVILVSGIVLSIPLAWIHNLLAFALFYGIYFFAIGGIEPLISSVTTTSTPPERRGVLFGVQSLVGCVGWAVSPLIGSIISINISIQSILVVTPIILSLSLTTLLVLEAKRKKMVKVQGELNNAF